MKRLLLAILLMVPALTWADNHGSGIALPGMMFKQGIVCTDPYTAKDLLDVINDQEKYFVYLRGYEVSGHCMEYNGQPFELRQKLLSYSNTTFDGYKAELWAVEIDNYDKHTIKNVYALVFPGAMNTRDGPAI